MGLNKDMENLPGTIIKFIRASFMAINIMEGESCHILMEMCILVSFTMISQMDLEFTSMKMEVST